MLAIARGEQISAIWFVVVALSSYAIAYRFYAYYIQIKIMRTDDANATAAERVQDGANFESADRRVLFGQHFAAISGAGPLVGPILAATDDANATAAERVQDGANFESADRRVLFGQHFAAISGAGPLVGPILAAQMGYLPSVLWIILGVIFAGAVQDMLMLWISAKRRGRSFGQMATDEMGKVGVLIISVFLVVVAAIAMAFLALVAIKAMASSPWAVFSLGMTIPIALIMGCYERFLRPGRVIETTILGFVLLVLAIVGGGMIAANPVLAPIFTLNAKQLVVALVLYSFAAAALPHWLLVTPRDYLSALMKIGTLALLVIGVVIANPQVQVPALTTLASRSNGPMFSGNLFPFLFITIACGALSGFHGAVSSGLTPKAIEKENQIRMIGYGSFSGNLFPFLFITIACGALSGFHGAVSSGLTPKAIEKENQIRMIGYGSMLVESFTAIIALIAAVTISQGVYFSMNMSPSQIEATAGSAYSASASPEQNAAAAVSRMDVHNIEGQRMRVEWQSDGTVYTGAEALDAAAHDVGEETLVSRTGGATTFAIGMANFLRSYLGGEESMAFWYHFAIMFEALFILTTVDNGTRVARYQIGDLLGNVRRLRKFADPTWRPGNLITTFVATALWGTMLYMGVSDANGGINAMVPIFGISNQLLSAGCFMLVTVCVVKAGLGQYAWIPVVPLVWDVAVTFTADFEKIFDPQLGYFATASSLRASIDSGQLEGEALATAYASLSNAYLDGVLSVFFLVMMAAFLAVGLKTIVATVRARAYGDHLTSQEPFLESNWFAPSGLIATRLERKVQREFEQRHARRAELG